MTMGNYTEAGGVLVLFCGAVCVHACVYMYVSVVATCLIGLRTVRQTLYEQA